jgi:hypothetical protein
MSIYFGGSKKKEVNLVPISELRAHELPEESVVYELEQDMRGRGILVKPIVVDRDTMIILDGHCRCSALRRLGCSKVAAKLVDYKSCEIAVEGVDKRQVIEAGLSGALMKPKTSRHILKKGGAHISEICEDAFIPLAELV